MSDYWDVTEVEKKWKEHASEENSSPHDKLAETCTILHSQASIHNHLLPSLFTLPLKTKAFETARSVSFLPWALATRHSMDPIALHAAFVEVWCRVTGIVASYHQGIIGNHRHCHQGWLVGWFSGIWTIGRWNGRTNGAGEFVVPWVYNKRRIDGSCMSCWCMLMLLEESWMIFLNHLRIIFESSWWLSLVVWLFGYVWMLRISTYLHHWGGLLLWCFGIVDWMIGWVVQSHLFETPFPIFELEKSTKSLQKLPWFHTVSCLIFCLESTFFLQRKVATGKWNATVGRWEPRTSASARSCVNRVADWREFREFRRSRRVALPKNTLRLYKCMWRIYRL